MSKRALPIHGSFAPFAAMREGQNLLVGAEPCQLAEEAEERSLAKWVGDGGVEGQGRIFAAEGMEPPLGDPRGHQVTLVDEKQEVLVLAVALQVALEMPAAGALGGRMGRSQGSAPKLQILPLSKLDPHPPSFLSHPLLWTVLPYSQGFTIMNQKSRQTDREMSRKRPLTMGSRASRT